MCSCAVRLGETQTGQDGWDLLPMHAEGAAGQSGSSLGPSPMDARQSDTSAQGPPQATNTISKQTSKRPPAARQNTVWKRTLERLERCTHGRRQLPFDACRRCGVVGVGEDVRRKTRLHWHQIGRRQPLHLAGTLLRDWPADDAHLRTKVIAQARARVPGLRPFRHCAWTAMISVAPKAAAVVCNVKGEWHLRWVTHLGEAA